MGLDFAVDELYATGWSAAFGGASIAPTAARASLGCR